MWLDFRGTPLCSILVITRKAGAVSAVRPQVTIGRCAPCSCRIADVVLFGRAFVRDYLMSFGIAELSSRRARPPSRERNKVKTATCQVLAVLSGMEFIQMR